MNILKENSSIIIIIIYAYILFNYIKEDDYVTMGILTFAAGLLAYKMKKTVEGFTPLEQLQEKSIPELQELLRTFPSSQEDGFVMPTNKDTLINMVRESELGAKTEQEIREIGLENGLSTEDYGDKSKSEIIQLVLNQFRIDQPENTAAPSGTTEETTEEQENRVLPGENVEYRRLSENAANEEITDDSFQSSGSITQVVSDGKDVDTVSNTATAGDENFEEGSEVTLKSAQNNLFRMGPYDGLCISKGPEKNYELADEEEIRTYFGVQAPMNMEIGQPNNSDLSGPTVDGDDESPQRLSMLSNNKSRFDCCTNSPFTTNSGCICLTNKQRHFINTRGFNKSQPDI